MYFIIPTLLICSFLLAVILTPRVASIAERFDLLDKPSSRKVHSLAIPRIGGVAIFLSFFMTISICMFLGVLDSLFYIEKEALFLFAGGIIAFGLGFFDDMKNLGPKTKFAIQIIAAYSAYLGGIKIDVIGVPIIGAVNFGILAFL